MPELKLIADVCGLYTTFLIAKPNAVFGRASDADIQYIIADISRRHCLFEHKADCWYVIDLNSTNGVRVNGEKILPNVARDIKPGDVIRCCDVNLHVVDKFPYEE
jgi:pSer/pThr/pTyr-binding forkhead associated (FHA) protein